MVTFTPKTEEELQKEKEKREAERLLPKGEYDFEVVKAYDGHSRAGNEMITLYLKVFGNDGQEVIVKDYLLVSEDFEWKLRHAADACGLLEKYNGGQLLGGDFEGASGRCFIKINKANGSYPASNGVDDYVKKSVGSVSKVDSAPIDDEIPF